MSQSAIVGPNRTYIEHIEGVIMPVLQDLALEALLFEKSENEQHVAGENDKDTVREGLNMF
jgi:hypothetical protein